MHQPTSAEIIAQFANLKTFKPGPPTASAGRLDAFFDYDRPETYGVHVEHVKVPLRDGSHLACDVRRPAEADGAPAGGRFPGIVVEFNAYGAQEFFGSGADYYVARGYVAAVGAVRGSGESPGHLEPFGPQEQRDNVDLIEWLAAQPFSTGKVGQMGVSYGGHTTLLGAVSKPAHLTAVIAIQALSDWYENTIYRGGIPNALIREWQSSTAPETLETYPQHPLYDDYWRERSVKARWDDLTIPVLDVGGWFDQYRDAMVQNFQARPQNTWMVAGPWTHGMVPGQFEDIAAACYLAWWDHWLSDRPGALPQAKVTSYEATGTGPGLGWQQFSTWPPAESEQAFWNLTADGMLSASGQAPATAQFEANTGRLTFDTPPLPSDVVLAGGFEAALRASFTAEDGNIAVVLEDVGPDGEAARITNGWLKASHRHGNEHRQSVTPGDFYDLEVPLWPAHTRILAGHSLRLTVSSDDYPQIDTEAPAGTVRLELGSAATQLRYRRMP